MTVNNKSNVVLTISKTGVQNMFTITPKTSNSILLVSYEIRKIFK